MSNPGQPTINTGANVETRVTENLTPPADQTQGNGSGPDQKADIVAVPPNESGKRQAVLVALGAPGGLAAAVIVLITAFQLVSWSNAQTALVSAEAAAVIGFVGALVGHLWPESSEEPVALAATFTATLAATLALCAGFGWLSWSQSQITAVMGVTTAIIGIGSALFARQRVNAKVTQKGATQT
jgi:hypothetical protein